MAMIPKIKAKLLAALRSGKYVQTKKGFLQWQPGKKKAWQYCCLGVLMCVQGAQPKKVLPYVNTSHVPIAFAAGLTVEDQLELAKMNDSDDSTFDSIADYIEATL